MNFLKAYIISMRLHFGFITGISSWIGISYYEYLNPTYHVSPILKIFVLIAIFLSYGVNQVINDYFGVEEDRVNAPNRPMVTGELNPKSALFTSVFLMVALGIISFLIAPWSVIPLVLGVVLNIIYEYAKSVSILGNIIFGLSINVCPVYGFLVSGPLQGKTFTTAEILVLLILVLTNGLMTFYTYFKDYEGDKKAGKRTFIVKHGVDVAKTTGIIFSLVPILLFLLFTLMGIFNINQISGSPFWFCLIFTFFLQLWTAGLYYKTPTGNETYFNLVTNIQACVASQITVIAIFDGRLALMLFSASYILIGFIFSFHKNAKS